MCFSLSWVENLLIWLVVIGAIVALLRLVIPLVLAQFGGAGTVVMRAINIIMWMVVVIALVIFIFDLIACIAPIGLPRLR